MALMARDKGGQDFKKLPPGAHFAVCNMIVDMGIQEGFQGKPQHKVYLRWECPDERVEFTKKGDTKPTEGPMTIGKTYTLSLSEKASLRHDLENWRGQAFTKEELDGFDIFKVLGKACQLMVVHEAGTNGKVYANINGVMGLAREQRDRAKTYKPANDLLGFSLEAPSADAFGSLPEWLRQKIDARLEDSAAGTTAAAPADQTPDFNDDIPF